MTFADWDDDPEAQEWMRAVHDELVPKMAGSPIVASIVPNGPTDIKFAVETGMAIMLDKPIILLVAPGTSVPGKLAKVADAIVEFDQADMTGTTKRLHAAMEELGL